jgi:D-alanyl-D-alanine carboxypeptidase/D-alanyl-D-alanine-endopeptidase (penicillin-binding protein 4)
LNRRQPIFLMLGFGVLLIMTLCLIPYWLVRKSDASQTIAASLSTRSETEAKKRQSEPSFDVAEWYAARGEELETHGVLIETLSGEMLLASHNADVTFNPASLVKLATSLVALKKLGADYRFQTRVYADGRIDSAGTLQGKLVVIGSDPTFGDIGAAMIARELRARGIKNVKGNLGVSQDFCFNFSDSAEESAARLSKALKLNEAQTEIVNAPAVAALFKFNSYPLKDLLLYMNAHSSNFVSERIGALIGGAQGVEQFIVKELQLPASEVTIARVSGREHNRLTPRGLLIVIRALLEEAARQSLQPEDIMPVACDDAGTLRRRLAGTGLEGAVVGKTGTLTAEVDGGMASLAGLVYTKDGGPVVFVILDQGNRIWENRQLEDQLLADVVNTLAAPRAVASPTPRQMLSPDSLKISD